MKKQNKTEKHEQQQQQQQTIYFVPGKLFYFVHELSIYFIDS